MDYELTNSFSFLNSIVANALDKHFAKNLQQAELPLTPDQFKILIWLWQKDGKSQQEIACLARRDRASITRILDTLERKQLIVRKKVENDRRIKSVHLTEQAHALKDRAYKVILQTLDEALHGIKPSDLAICRSILKKVIANLSC